MCRRFQRRSQERRLPRIFSGVGSREVRSQTLELPAFPLRDRRAMIVHHVVTSVLIGARLSITATKEPIGMFTVSVIIGPLKNRWRRSGAVGVASRRAQSGEINGGVKPRTRQPEVFLNPPVSRHEDLRKDEFSQNTCDALSERSVGSWTEADYIT